MKKKYRWMPRQFTFIDDVIMTAAKVAHLIHTTRLVADVDVEHGRWWRTSVDHVAQRVRLCVR